MEKLFCKPNHKPLPHAGENVQAHSNQEASVKNSNPTFGRGVCTCLIYQMSTEHIFSTHV